MKMTKRQAGHLGALARMRKYGNPGTLEGRRKGGINSILIQTKGDSNFKTAKKHTKPRNSGLLSEFMGILIGDGHLSNYQVLVTTNSETDLEHAIFIKKLINKLFSLNPVMKYKKGQKAVDIIVSSVNLVKWLSSKGMPQGNKLDKGLATPKWITGNRVYEQRFLKGLFDTDGCVYMDKHIINGRIYKNQGWAITSYSSHLRDDIFQTLKKLGYNPTLAKTQKSIYMRRKYDIDKYFREIGTRNRKHLN